MIISPTFSQFSLSPPRRFQQTIRQKWITEKSREQPVEHVHLGGKVHDGAALAYRSPYNFINKLLRRGFTRGARCTVIFISASFTASSASSCNLLLPRTFSALRTFNWNFFFHQGGGGEKIKEGSHLRVDESTNGETIDQTGNQFADGVPSLVSETFLLFRLRSSRKMKIKRNDTCMYSRRMYTRQE